MRYTKAQYETAIRDLQLGIQQLEPDGNPCEICGDGGHMAFECGFNPLVAMSICRDIAENSRQLHDTLHNLAGFNIQFGVQIGPAKVVLPNREE